MMQLYSGTTCPFSHRCRFVLYEKGMDFQVIDVDLYSQFPDWSILDTRDVATWVARLCTILYFAFFFLMPWYTRIDKVKPVPERVPA